MLIQDNVNPKHTVLLLKIDILTQTDNGERLE